MDRVAPSIEELQQKLLGNMLVRPTDPDALTIFTFYEIHAQAMLHICLELEQINNNLESLRGKDART